MKAVKALNVFGQFKKYFAYTMLKIGSENILGPKEGNDNFN